MKQETKQQNKTISIVIPAYKAENYIVKNILSIKKVMDNLRYDYEIIVVEDGKTDKTWEKVDKLAKKNNKIRIVGYLTNLGKGHAVKFGMARAKGDIIGFMDAGPELNPESIPLLLEHFEWYDADIIVGSKRHAASKVEYPWQRRILSFGYQVGVRILFGLKVRDTQVGMKFFRREVLEKILPRLLVKKFAFDIEMLAVANSLGYTKIYEAPTQIKMKFGGGVSTIASKGFIKTVFNMAWDTVAVFYRLKILKYYDYKNRKNWITPDYLKIKK